MTINDYRGSGVALITPFTSSMEIDFAVLEDLISSHLESGTDYIVALGTTAETATLTVKEKQEVIDFIALKINNKIPLVVGVGGNNTRAVIDDITSINLSKADAILSVVPYYNKPTQKGIFQHYMAIAEACALPIIMYNVPGRTGAHMSAETTLSLAHKSKKFVGTKEASGNLTEVATILRDRPERFSVISGDDNAIVPIISLGGDGVISVAANVIPKGIKMLTQAALDGNFATASQLHLRYINIFKKLFVEGNPGGVKAALHSIGKIENVLRLPLVPVSPKVYAEIKKEVEALVT